MGTKLELDQITVTYGAVTALEPLSMVVDPGEFFCLLGPSGCGKSTTLGVIAGFLVPGGGRVLVNGVDVTHAPPQRRQMGVVFQSYALFPHMTAAENVAYGLQLRKKPAADVKAKVDEMLSLVRLSSKADRLPARLSGGEQQRVAIARALAINPTLLLLDEPLSNLDARLREEMQEELKRIQATTGLTTIFVTHDQEEAFGLGNRIAVLNSGRLEQIGTPNDIYKAPASLFVASFIGRSSRFDAQPDGSNGSSLVIGNHRFQSDLARPTGQPELTFMLRPEEISLSSNPQLANSIAGKVVSATYSGSFTNYRVETDLGALEVCQIAGAPKHSVGESIHAGWLPDAGVLLAKVSS